MSFAASLLITACSSERPANSNAVVNISTTATPAPVNSPVQSDLAAKLQNMGVSNTKKNANSKSNVELLSASLEEYKRDYQDDPGKANERLNAALSSFNDADVKNQILKIKDFAYSEVTQAEPANNVDGERQRIELENMIAGKIAPLDGQLKALNEKLDKNDSSKIPLAILAQTAVLGMLFVGGLGLGIYQLRKAKAAGGPTSSNPAAPDDAAVPDSKNGTAAEPPANWPREPIVYQPHQGKQETEKQAAGLSGTEKTEGPAKTEKLLGDLIEMVGQLSQQIADSENSITQKLGQYGKPVSEPPPASHEAEPLVPKEIYTPPIFTPTLVRDLKEKYQGRSRPLEKDKFSDLLIPSYRDETFLLTENQGGDGSFYLIIPTKERFRRSDDYYNIQAYFDCDNAGAGELLVEKPALVESEGDGWKLRNKGKISIQ